MTTRRLAAAALGAALLTLPACSDDPAPATGTTTSTTATSRRPAATPRPAAAGADRELARSVAKVARAHPEADITLAHAPVGARGPVEVHGDPTTLVAWSTIKVPLALAAIRSADGGDWSGDVERALTASDNAAADSLWQRLGAGEAAAGAIETQLRRGHDTRTEVPAEVTVPGYSAFGQSRWRLTDQTRFTAALPCLTGSSSVTEAMGRVVDGQRWGLGTIPGARFKGGWGSTPEGYVVRQLGIVPGTKGDLAVTLQVRTGTHEEGTAIADELARSVRLHRGTLEAGRC